MKIVREIVFDKGKVPVLFEDNHIIVVIKPSGLLSQSDRGGGTNLLDIIKEDIRKTYNKPGNVYAALVHRLDRSVDGVMVYAKTSKAAARLSLQFQKHTTRKIYRAVVHGIPELREDTRIDYIKKDERNRIALASDPDRGQMAKLTYRTIATLQHSAFGPLSLLEVELFTGRFHQIRFQLSAMGHPIVGDKKYGAPRGLKDFALGLRARSLEIEHPTLKKRMLFESDDPPGWPAGIDAASFK